jgi:hypothetical protein
MCLAHALLFRDKTPANVNRTAGASRGGVTWYEARYAPVPFLLSRASPFLRCTHSLSVVKRVSVHPNVDACVGYVQYMMLANAIAFVDGEMIYLAKPRGGSLGSIQISR